MPKSPHSPIFPKRWCQGSSSADDNKWRSDDNNIEYRRQQHRVWTQAPGRPSTLCESPSPVYAQCTSPVFFPNTGSGADGDLNPYRHHHHLHHSGLKAPAEPTH